MKPLIPRKTKKNCLASSVFALALLPALSAADVTGAWNTTGLTRIDVTPIRANGLQPEHSIEIADGNYSFDDSGQFIAGDITGIWKQNRNQYSVKVDRLALEDQFRASLEQTPGIVVNLVKLLKSNVTGKQLDNGIWGSERYEYRVDSSLDGYRDVIRLVMTVNLAGYSDQTQNAQFADPQPQAMAPLGRLGPMDLAASAVIRHLTKQAAATE